jgi:molybdopterin-containing oxidoreductase family membrane subunit
VISLTRDFLPAIWRDYSPSWVDIGILVGTLGFFSFLFLIFLRFIPFVPVAELKEMRRELVHEEQAQEGERHEA